jgi:hypothetical protein
MYRSTYSWPRNWLEVSGQLHAPVALLPGKRAPVTHWIGGCVGRRTGLEYLGRRKIFRSKNLYAFLFSPMHATWNLHLIPLQLIIIIIFGENYKCIKLLSPDPSSDQLFSSALCSQTPSVCVLFLMSETKFRTRIEPQVKLQSSILMLMVFNSWREDSRFWTER